MRVEPKALKEELSNLSLLRLPGAVTRISQTSSPLHVRHDDHPEGRRYPRVNQLSSEKNEIFLGI